MPDKMIVTKTKLDALATSVSQKTGVAAPLTIAEMKTAIDNLVIPVTTPTYMWKDANDYVHFSSVFHNGYQINVASVTENHSWVTIWEATISEWTQQNNCYTTTLNQQVSFPENIEYRITYDGTVYMVTEPDNGVLGSDVHGWDGTSALNYPFGLSYSEDQIYVDVTTDGTHTFKIEYEE